MKTTNDDTLWATGAPSLIPGHPLPWVPRKVRTVGKYRVMAVDTRGADTAQADVTIHVELEATAERGSCLCVGVLRYNEAAYFAALRVVLDAIKAGADLDGIDRAVRQALTYQKNARGFVYAIGRRP